MSRSHKKFLVNNESNLGKFGKRIANRKARRYVEIMRGSGFKKYYSRWKIGDWRILENFYTAEQFRRKWFDENDKELTWARKYFRTWKEAYRHWLRGYRMK